MSIKQAFITPLVFLTSTIVVYAINATQDITIPNDLEEMGYTNLTIVDYRKEAGIEFYTFSEWKTTESGDTVTFVVENGTVTKDFNGGIRTDIPERKESPAGKKQNKEKTLMEAWFGK